MSWPLKQILVTGFLITISFNISQEVSGKLDFFPTLCCFSSEYTGFYGSRRGQSVVHFLLTDRPIQAANSEDRKCYMERRMNIGEEQRFRDIFCSYPTTNLFRGRTNSQIIPFVVKHIFVMTKGVIFLYILRMTFLSSF